MEEHLLCRRLGKVVGGLLSVIEIVFITLIVLVGRAAQVLMTGLCATFCSGRWTGKCWDPMLFYGCDYLECVLGHLVTSEVLSALVVETCWLDL